MRVARCLTPGCKGVRNAVAERLLCRRGGVDVDQPLGVPTTGVGLHGRCLGAQQTINGSVRRIQPILNSESLQSLAARSIRVTGEL